MVESSLTIEASRPALEAAVNPPCFHCGTLCAGTQFTLADKAFCCHGCQTVFELLTENGLGEFYRLSEAAGVRVRETAGRERFKFLDEPAVRGRLVDFADAKHTRVTFQIPAIHCVACVWLLENLFRLNAGIGQAQVNYPRKEVALIFDTGRVRLSEVVALLTSLGYEPELKLADLDTRPRSRSVQRLWVQLGVAGFAFGNIMFLSLSNYLGLDQHAGGNFLKLTGLISFLLALPVVIYSAQDYWRMAWTSLRRHLLNIDVPIATGIAAIFIQSSYEVFAGRGNGYFDSLTGLIFFLLCGKWFQQKTYDRLAFDRDYKSFFPLSVTRKAGTQEESVSLSQLQVGDRLLLRNGELIPADARLVSGAALIDYSFVTGESEPMAKQAEDYLYAGGRQMGGAVEVEILKAVSQSYLTSLWNQDAFRKDKGEVGGTLTNRYSQRFTKLVIAVAVGSGAFWAVVDPALSVKAFTSVLIVACPCALALAAPFALGSAQRALGRRGVFLKNPYVLESLAQVDSVVFDKTGTLTAAGAGAVIWQGATLTAAEAGWIRAVARHSTHPLSVRIGTELTGEIPVEVVRSFHETAGSGVEGSVAGHQIWLGSAAWQTSRQVPVPVVTGDAGSMVHVAVDGQHRGAFILASAVRPETDRLIALLSAQYEVALLSGDNEKERDAFAKIFGAKARLQFNQSPANKLGFIRGLQESGRRVMMVGDGLNDAGALSQSNVGVAVVENVGAFSPASDVILAADMVPRLAEVLQFSKRSVKVVRLSFLISAAYNAVGVAIAARGWLSPVVCAVLMPVSSVSVVAFACVTTSWLGRKLGQPEVRS